MREKITCGLLLVLASALGAAGCRSSAPAVSNNAPSNSAPQRTATASAPGQEADVEAALATVSSFTDELLQKIEAASDPLTGLSDAQKFFDSRKREVREKIVSARESQSARESAAAKGRLLEGEVDNTSRMSGLQTRYLDHSMRSAAFKTRLDKLVGDYQELFEK